MVQPVGKCEEDGDGKARRSAGLKMGRIYSIWGRGWEKKMGKGSILSKQKYTWESIWAQEVNHH